MLRLLAPYQYLKTVYELDLHQLKKQGIKGLVFDLDNTLIPWDSDHLPEKLLGFFKEVKRLDFRVCIVSNNTHSRVTQLAESLGIPAISKAIKPRRKAFRRAMNIMETNSDNTAVIGDQIFTDVLGGNRLGLLTILISPINKQEFIGTKFVRRVERIVLKRLRKKGLLEE